MLPSEARPLKKRRRPRHDRPMSFIVIVPARAASTRLPGKQLLDVGGLPMVVRTARQAARSAAARILIATDHADIARAAAEHGVEALMTRPDHPTGTDRLSEVATALGLDDDDVVVNVQGDEPLIDPALIDAVATLLTRHPDAAIATCAAPILDAHTLFDPNAVKVVLGANDRALYFSRAPVPGPAMRWPMASGVWPPGCQPGCISACTPTGPASCASSPNCLRAGSSASNHWNSYVPWNKAFPSWSIPSTPYRHAGWTPPRIRPGCAPCWTTARYRHIGPESAELAALRHNRKNFKKSD